MRTEPELLNERLDRLATVLDEIMPNCALLVRDAIDLLKEQEDLGTELTNAVELIHKKNERIEKLLKEQEPVRCKDCKHRPKKPDLETYESGFDIEFPKGSKCPCRCCDDEWYSWYPEDEWFCANGERKET